MTIEELIKDLGIKKEYKVVDDKYIITLDDSNDFSRMYTILDKYDGADLDPEGMIMSDKSTVMTYLTDDFDITLKADFDNDAYTLIIEEANE